ncbi:MAG: helicase C-terminal domain-containing protein [Candidatus Izemoplasma sp.]|nr:helicase C-terminal domain-containing protein [Candidatus Izemoplasma sp.]
MKSLKVSVKDLVTFIHRGGDLTNEFKSNARAKQGTELHTFLQEQYLEEDQKEVFVKETVTQDDYEITLSGRIDGVLLRDHQIIIEEIKSTQVALELLDETSRPEHLAQAKIYAYLYLQTLSQKSITVYLTYIHTQSKATKIIKKRYNQTQLKRFFDNTILEYTTWLDIYEAHHEQRQASIEGLTFPFPDYREGQYTFMGAIYQTLMQKDILYSIAPTGIGKTVAALFSSLKTMDKETDKIFYLTAKNQGKHIVIDTVNLLKQHGLITKSVVLHSKEAMCLMDKVDCDPDICPYAKGYFEREKDALEDIFVHDDVYDQRLIKQYGEYHNICPHEFSLSISNYSDIVICDYNYAFDPRVHLIRYFEESYYTPKLLIDEAHNMIDRSRNMYSAVLQESSLKTLKASITRFKGPIHAALNAVLGRLNALKETHELAKNPFYYQEENILDLIEKIDFLIVQLDKILVEHKRFEARKDVLDVYFELVQYRRIAEFYNEHYRLFMHYFNEEITITERCFNAADFITEIIEYQTDGAIFFSATLEPIDYYVTLITNGEGKTIQIPSPFDPKRLGLFIEGSTSTRYRDRDLSISKIIDTIYAMLEAKQGNYIAFFPSYAYMNKVLTQFDTSGYHVVVQERNMRYSERKSLLETFQSDQDTSTIGFFVLGGSFSEGIDYVGDLLHGVLIVGVALPMFNKENELLRSYFDHHHNNGFHYAYTYPGMNKVIQAVGRVIRQDDDQGIAILFDDRYLHHTYTSLFPKHWAHIKTIPHNDIIIDYLNHFWDNKQ